jgi:hypothetical protein
MSKMPDAKLLDLWKEALPFSTPDGCAAHYMEEMKKFNPDYHEGFYDFFVQRMFVFWAQYHPTLLYRLIHYYPEWAKKEKFHGLFLEHFPSAADFIQSLPQMIRDLMQDSETYNTGRALVFGRPIPTSKKWEDRVYGTMTNPDGTQLAAEAKFYFKDVIPTNPTPREERVVQQKKEGAYWSQAKPSPSKPEPEEGDGGDVDEDGPAVEEA